MTPRTRKPGFCRATGRQWAVEIRVYDNVIMKHDTRTPAPQATARAAVEWPEPTPTRLPAGTVAAAQPAQGTPVESCAATPPTTADAAPPKAVEPPDLDRLGDQIAKLSARIDAATYDLLCHLHQFDRHHGWEGFRSCAHWLNWRTGLDLGAARERLRVAAALADLNHIAAALACGQRGVAASEPWGPATDLDTGQAVIEQAGGLHVGRDAVRRVACDAGLVVLRHGSDGEVLDAGRRTRTVPTALRRALQDRDRNQCQFPGCESRHCDAHHVVHWADGGETRLSNLILKCGVRGNAESMT